MTNTTNYNLKKFNMQDRIDATISGMSSNMDDIDVILESKVDKVEGKALSTNDFTNEEKEKLASLSNYDDSEILESLETKVDKVEGKSLSTNDYTNEDKVKLTNLVEIKSIGENLTLDEDGELSADGGVLPVASSTTLGGIKVGNNLSIDADGTLNATGGLASEADPTVPSHVKSITANDISNWNAKSDFDGDYNSLSNKPTIPSAYQLPIASSSTLGGVKIGSNLSIDASGTIDSVGQKSPIDNAEVFNDVAHNIAGGICSHAEGSNTYAAGNYSHAEGEGATAGGNYSHAEGQRTVAAGNCQHAGGRYNVKNFNNTYAEIIGNGTSNNNRSNARTLDWNGNGWYAGKLTVGAGPADNMDVATKEYVDTAVGSATGGTSGGEITNDEDTSVPIYKVWVGTIEEYEALELIDPNTEYNIIEE